MGKPVTQVIAFFVRDLRSSRIAHWETFDATGMAASVVAKRISSRSDELAAQYGDPYDVEWEGVDSLEALHRLHPELPKPS